MKFALVHISGKRQGQTQYFDCTRLSLGSGHDNDVVFPDDGRHPTVPQHVELYEADCQIHLRNLDPNVTTLVNHNPLVEATLQDQDLLQLGPMGPKLRFRIQAEEYAACKRSREIWRDAMDVAAEAKTEGRGSWRSFVGQLVYDLRRHATRPIKMMMAALFILVVGGLGGMAYYFYSTETTHEQHIAALLKELESARLTQAELEQRTQEERARMADALTTRQTEIDRLVAMLEEQHRQGSRVSPEEVRLLKRRLQELESERTSAQSLIKRYGHSVCLLYGTYGFLQKGQTTGDPGTLFEYTGTAFLVDESGLIITNRHLVEPWTMDPSGMEIVQSGFQPKLVTLLAYFPDNPEPSQVMVVRKSEEGDLALGQLAMVPERVRPIPLRTPAPLGIVGEAVVVLGYPVGVEGLLARMKRETVDALLKNRGPGMERLVRNIAEQHGIRPLATQGHIGDIVPGRVVYDAQTTGGSSGSPVFNIAGDVIAVNSAYLGPFRGGAGFGVPISQALTLISEGS